MKIRCEQDSIRLRLRKSELAQLKNEGWVRTSIHFPLGEILSWELAISETSPNLDAAFEQKKYTNHAASRCRQALDGVRSGEP